MNEKSMELPEGEMRKLDYQKLKKLTFNAAKETLNLLQGISVPQGLKMIFRGNDKSVFGNCVSFPHYQDSSVYKKIDEIWDNEISMRLLNYLWDNNSFKIKITGKNPNRKTWGRFVYRDLVHVTLLKALEIANIREYIMSGYITDWNLPNDILYSIVDKVVENSKDNFNKVRTVIAICVTGRSK